MEKLWSGMCKELCIINKFSNFLWSWLRFCWLRICLELGICKQYKETKQKIYKQHWRQFFFTLNKQTNKQSLTGFCLFQFRTIGIPLLLYYLYTTTLFFPLHYKPPRFRSSIPLIHVTSFSTIEVIGWQHCSNMSTDKKFKCILRIFFYSIKSKTLFLH